MSFGVSATYDAKLNAMNTAMKPLQSKGYKYRHFVVDGIYAREMTIPQGGMVIGVVHAQETMTIVTRGAFTLVSEEGTRTIRAGAVIVSKPGSRRACYALEAPATLVTIHRVHSEDLAEIIKELTPEADKVTMGVEDGLLSLYRNGELIRHEEIQSNSSSITGGGSAQRLLPFDD